MFYVPYKRQNLKKATKTNYYKNLKNIKKIPVTPAQFQELDREQQKEITRAEDAYILNLEIKHAKAALKNSRFLLSYPTKKEKKAFFGQLTKAKSTWRSVKFPGI